MLRLCGIHEMPVYPDAFITCTTIYDKGVGYNPLVRILTQRKLHLKVGGDLYYELGDKARDSSGHLEFRKYIPKTQKWK